MSRQSVAVILSAGGAVLDLRSLGDLPRARIVRAEFAWGDRSACVAATLEHECECGELLAARRRIAELERKVGQQELELDFFGEALRRIAVGGKRSAR